LKNGNPFLEEENMATQQKSPMGKDDLVRAFAAKAETTLVDANKFVGALIDIIVTTLETSNLQLVGFGSFRRVSRPEHQGRNPKTGEIITVPASSTVRFKPAAALKMRAQKTSGHKGEAGSAAKGKPGSKQSSTKKR
jgi:DNA-binding protein HU-beta